MSTLVLFKNSFASSTPFGSSLTGGRKYIIEKERSFLRMLHLQTCAWALKDETTRIKIKEEERLGVKTIRDLEHEDHDSLKIGNRLVQGQSGILGDMIGLLAARSDGVVWTAESCLDKRMKIKSENERMKSE